MKKSTKYLLTGFLSFVIVAVMLSIPKTVHSKADMKAMKFGYPIPFVTQNLTRYDPPFPWKYSFSSPWENPSNISWPNFLLSYLTTFVLVGFAVTGVEKIFLRKLLE